MTKNGASQDCISRFPKKMLTLNRNEVIPDDEFGINPLMKKKLITYPHCKIDEHMIPISEYRKLLKTEHKYCQQLQAQQVIDDIATFEKNNFGKAKLPNPIHIEPIDPTIKQVLDQFKVPHEASHYDYEVPKVRAKSGLTKERVITRPPTWNMLDEPFIPSKHLSVAPKINHPTPFKVPFANAKGKYGIPIYDKYIIKANRKKMNQFESKLRYMYTCDNQVHEETIKSRIQENRSKSMLRKEQQIQKCAEIGQEWALRLTGSYQTKSLPKKPKEDEISKDDLEALQYLAERDDEMARQKKQ